MGYGTSEDKKNFVECGKDIVAKMMLLYLWLMQRIQTNFQIQRRSFILYYHRQANGIPLLLLFNKNDLPDARPAEEIVSALGIKQMKGREIAYYEVSCKDILNIDTTLDWLTKHSK